MNKIIFLVGISLVSFAQAEVIKLNCFQDESRIIIKADIEKECLEISFKINGNSKTMSTCQFDERALRVNSFPIPASMDLLATYHDQKFDYSRNGSISLSLSEAGSGGGRILRLNSFIQSEDSEILFELPQELKGLRCILKKSNL